MATVNPIILRGYGPQQRIITQGYGWIAEEGRADLFATFALRQIGTKDLLAEFTIRRAEDLFAVFWVGYPAAQDLKAVFWTSTIWAAPLDLLSWFYVRTEEFDAELLEIEPARRMVVTGAVEEAYVGPAGRQFAVGPERELKLETPGEFKIGGLDREVLIKPSRRLQIRGAFGGEAVRGKRGRRMRIR